MGPPCHLHVMRARRQLLQHLGQPLFPRLCAFGTRDPRQIIIPLIGWPRIIGVAQSKRL